MNTFELCLLFAALFACVLGIVALYAWAEKRWGPKAEMDEAVESLNPLFDSLRKGVLSILGLREVVVPVGVHSFTVTYNPNLVTSNFMRRLETADLLDSVEATRVFFETLIADWDLKDADGNPLPLTEETIMALPLPVLHRTVSAISKDMHSIGDPGR